MGGDWSAISPESARAISDHNWAAAAHGEYHPLDVSGAEVVTKSVSRAMQQSHTFGTPAR